MSSERRRIPFSKWTSRFLWAAVIVFLALYALFFLKFSVSLIAYPFDWEETDGQVLITSRLIAQGRSIYEDPLQFPMFTYIYPPLYPGLVAFLMRFFGEGLAVARAVSLLSTIGIVFMIYRIVRKSGSSALIASVSALLLFAFPLGTEWLTSTRTDALFCLLLLAGFSMLPWAADRESSRLRLLAPAAVLLLAMLTKQHGISAAVVAALVVGAVSVPRGLIFSSVFGLGSLLVFQILQEWSSGWFYKDVIGHAAHLALTLPIDAGRLREYSAEFLTAYGAPIAVIAAAAVKFRLRREHLAWYLLFVLAASWGMQTGRNGFAHNHFIPSAAATCILFGISLETWRHWLRTSFPGRVHQISALVAAGLLVALLFPRNQLITLTPPSGDDARVWSETVDFMRDSPGAVLADYVPAAAAVSGKWEYATDSVNLMFSGLDDSSRIVPLLEERRFSAIVLYEHTFFSQEIKNTILNRYRLVRRLPVHTAEFDMERSLLWFVPK
jgi:4-amino-4-deoxy-L-arabinose transferase-like glycosyltransferase